MGSTKEERFNLNSDNNPFILDGIFTSKGVYADGELQSSITMDYVIKKQGERKRFSI